MGRAGAVYPVWQTRRPSHPNHFDSPPIARKEALCGPDIAHLHGQLRDPGPAGWGAVVLQGKARWEMSGAAPWTTISEMELLAALRLFGCCQNRALIELRSDSEYLVGCALLSSVGRVRNCRGIELPAPRVVGGFDRVEHTTVFRWRCSRSQQASRTDTHQCAGVRGRPRSLETAEDFRWIRLTRKLLSPCGEQRRHLRYQGGGSHEAI
jgi:hypothetical protein